MPTTVALWTCCATRATAHPGDRDSLSSDLEDGSVSHRVQDELSGLGRSIRTPRTAQEVLESTSRAEAPLASAVSLLLVATCLDARSSYGQDNVLLI
jgi:hypothetical protein